LCLLCRVLSQIPLQRLVANKLATSRLRGSYGETCLVDFGHYWELDAKSNSMKFESLLIFFMVH